MALPAIIRRNPIVWTALVVIVLDQITKYMVTVRVPLHARLPVVDGYLAITHVHNRGMAFGFFNTVDSSWLRWVLVAVALLAITVIWSYAREESGRMTVLLGFGAVLGGAVGNLIDRLRFGYVVDFVLAHWDRHEWPAFNVADAAITMGGVVLFLALARESPDTRSEDRPDNTGDPGVEAGEARHDQV